MLCPPPLPPTHHSILQETSKNLIPLFVFSREYQMGYKYFVKLFHFLTCVDLKKRIAITNEVIIYTATDDVLKYAITNYVIKCKIKNDVIRYAITDDVIKYAITNDEINNNSRLMFHACLN